MKHIRNRIVAALFALAAIFFAANLAGADPHDEPASSASSLTGTKLLDWKGDIASRMVHGIDRFLLRKLKDSVERRAKYWHRDFSSPEKYNASIEPNRKRLAFILGVRDPRVPFDAPELLATTASPALIAKGASYDIYAVRWPAFGDVHGEGLLLVPRGKHLADIVAIPDADQTPEMLAGLTPGLPAESQIARRLAESGCRVIVPTLIQRTATTGKISDREILYRSAFEMGRHIIGYELQKVLAAVDWFAKDAGGKPAKIAVAGWGEGGMLALDAGALDPRINSVFVSAYFGSRQNVWREPIYRNVFGVLDEFGDAELATMIAPRTLVIEASRGPELVVPRGTGGAPARLVTPAVDEVLAEFDRARLSLKGFNAPSNFYLDGHGKSTPAYGSRDALATFLISLSPGAKLSDSANAPKLLAKLRDAEVRQRRQFHELDRHNQTLLDNGADERKKFFANLDTTSLATFEKTIEPYRDYFSNEVIGRFDEPRLPLNPRSRKSYEGTKWVGYEVVLDVFPDVFAYGVLLVPKDLKPGERRPVVVCQHGLEGRPTDVILGGSPYYHDFAARLADRGYIIFAPQNPYLFGDRFRSLQRKANPLKKTLFSIIIPQHQQIVEWLGSLPNVDSKRIAFYGLSYGGKTAMRVPPLVPGYCLSICSGDFNDWIWKTAVSSRDLHYSYVTRSEYEMFEFDLGNTFNHAEMAMLIAPRPFMVERGHNDQVAADETVASEFAKVRYFYEARLKLQDRCRIEWFVGPHMINGKGTFEFLDQKLGWSPR